MTIHSDIVLEGGLALSPCELNDIVAEQINLDLRLLDMTSGLETMEYDYYIQVEANLNEHVTMNPTDEDANGLISYGLSECNFKHNDSNIGTVSMNLPSGVKDMKAGTVSATDGNGNAVKVYNIMVNIAATSDGITVVNYVQVSENDNLQVLPGPISDDHVGVWTEDRTNDSNFVDNSDTNAIEDVTATWQAGSTMANAVTHAIGLPLPLVDFTGDLPTLTEAVLQADLNSIAGPDGVEAELNNLYHDKPLINDWTINLSSIAEDDDNPLSTQAFRNLKNNTGIFNVGDKVVVRSGADNYKVKIMDGDGVEHELVANDSGYVYGVVKQAYPDSTIDRLVSFGDSTYDIGNNAADGSRELHTGRNLALPFAGVFSNGNTSVQNIAAKLNLKSVKCSHVGGYGYAYGKARIKQVTERPVDDWAPGNVEDFPDILDDDGNVAGSGLTRMPLSLHEQVDTYKTDMQSNTYGRNKAANTLHVISCGSNDLIDVVTDMWASTFGLYIRGFLEGYGTHVLTKEFQAWRLGTTTAQQTIAYHGFFSFADHTSAQAFSKFGSFAAAVASYSASDEAQFDDNGGLGGPMNVHDENLYATCDGAGKVAANTTSDFASMDVLQMINYMTGFNTAYVGLRIYKQIVDAGYAGGGDGDVPGMEGVTYQDLRNRVVLSQTAYDFSQAFGALYGAVVSSPNTITWTMFVAARDALKVHDPDGCAAGLAEGDKNQFSAMVLMLFNMMPKDAKGAANTIGTAEAPTDKRLLNLADALVEQAVSVAALFDGDHEDTNKVLLSNLANLSIAPMVQELGRYISAPTSSGEEKQYDFVALMSKTFNFQLAVKLMEKQVADVPGARRVQIYDLFAWSEMASEDVGALGYNMSVPAFQRGGDGGGEEVMVPVKASDHPGLSTDYIIDNGSGVMIVDPYKAIFADSLHTSAVANSFIANSMMHEIQLLMTAQRHNPNRYDGSAENGGDGGRTWTERGVAYVQALLASVTDFSDRTNINDYDLMVRDGVLDAQITKLAPWMRAQSGVDRFDSDVTVDARLLALLGFIDDPNFVPDTSPKYWTNHGKIQMVWEGVQNVAAGGVASNIYNVDTEDPFTDEHLALVQSEEVNLVSNDAIMNIEQITAELLEILGLLTSTPEFAYTDDGRDFMNGEVAGAGAGVAKDDAVTIAQVAALNTALSLVEGTDVLYSRDIMVELGHAVRSFDSERPERVMKWRLNNAYGDAAIDAKVTAGGTEVIPGAPTHYWSANAHGKNAGDPMTDGDLTTLATAIVAADAKLTANNQVTLKYMRLVGAATVIAPADISVVQESPKRTWAKLGIKYLSHAWEMTHQKQLQTSDAVHIAKYERWKLFLSELNVHEGQAMAFAEPTIAPDGTGALAFVSDTLKEIMVELESRDYFEPSDLTKEIPLPYAPFTPSHRNVKIKYEVITEQVMDLVGFTERSPPADTLTLQDGTEISLPLDALPAVAAAPTIRDQANYVVGTGFSIGASGVIADQFQINLEYQAGVDSAGVDVWNDWAGAIGGETASAGTNWHDPENYTLVVDVAGGLTASQYTGSESEPLEGDQSEDLQWTITGWGHTILGGYIDGNRLVVHPANTYRPFDAALNVNVQENFSGYTKTELTALTFEGDVDAIGDGTVFGVELLGAQPSPIKWTELGYKSLLGGYIGPTTYGGADVMTTAYGPYRNNTLLKDVMPSDEMLAGHVSTLEAGEEPTGFVGLFTYNYLFDFFIHFSQANIETMLYLGYAELAP